MTNPHPLTMFRHRGATARRRLVVVAPHPDDETLGCGLLIARAVRAGVAVAVVVLTDGTGSHPGSRRWPAAALGRLRRAELRRALARLGAGSARVVGMGWRDGAVAADGRALALRGVLTRLRAGVVVAASPADHHPDHRAGWRLVAAALKGTPTPLVAYAVWSRTGSGQGRRVRDPARAARGWAMRAHRSQTSAYIADDPAGFTFAAADLARLTGEAERFVRAVGNWCWNGREPSN